MLNHTLNINGYAAKAKADAYRPPPLPNLGLDCSIKTTIKNYKKAGGKFPELEVIEQEE